MRRVVIGLFTAVIAFAGLSGFGSPASALGFLVTYDSGGYGTAPVDPSSYGDGDLVTVLEPDPSMVRAHFTFSCWDDGLGTCYPALDSFTIHGPTTLTASWLEDGYYTLTYDANGGVGPVPVDTTHYYGGEQPAPEPAPVGLYKTGYTFAGWNTHANGSGIAFAHAGDLTITTATTVYAQWTANGGGGSSDSGSTPPPTPPPTPTVTPPKVSPDDAVRGLTNAVGGGSTPPAHPMGPFVSNLDQVSQGVGVVNNGVVVVMDSGVKQPVAFRDNPPDNVLIAMPSQRPAEVQLQSGTLSFQLDQQTGTTVKRQSQIVLGPSPRPSGSVTSGLQVVQGEGSLGNGGSNGAIGGLELSQGSTLRGVVTGNQGSGGTAGFLRTLDGSGSVSAETGEVRVVVRLRNSAQPTQAAVRSGEKARDLYVTEAFQIGADGTAALDIEVPDWLETGPTALILSITQPDGTTKVVGIPFTVAPAAGSLRVKVPFAFGESTLSEKAKTMLRKLVASVPQGGRITSMALGLTNPNPAASDTKLGRARAKAVATYLARFGLSTHYGPRAATKPLPNVPQSRRVDAVVTYVPIPTTG